MPAHCTPQQVGAKKLSNGQLMTEADRSTDALVDRLCKEAASWDKAPKEDLDFIIERSSLLSAIAKWIGQSCV